MSSDRATKPIRSTRESDPEWDEKIDRFVYSLGEVIDRLQDTEAAGDAEDLRALAKQLEVEAHEVGFPPMVDAAQGVQQACEEVNPDAVHKAVAVVTEIAGQIRRGHRSFA